MSKDIFKGPVAWMASNSVAANLIMIALIFGGLMMTSRVKQEVMPEFQMNIVSVSVPYPGASPEEVEQGILLAVEEEVRGLDDIKKVTATASEGVGSISVELTDSAEPNKSLQDIKAAVDRITSFPQDAERPIVRLLNNRREVISLVLYGDVTERELRDLSETVRDRLLENPTITDVSLLGVRPMEISIEIPQEKLRKYNITLAQVAQQIRRSAIELPAGGVKTQGGEILLRTTERRDYGSEFANIPVVTRPDGTRVTLADVATIVDGFRDTDQAAYFDGKRAVRVAVSRVGDQKPMEIAAHVKEFAKELENTLPPEFGVATWYDASEMYADRVNLLAKNAGLGLILVLIILGMFLEIRLAFWVMAGIPISILGAFLIFPYLGVSINMISLFAFIITLGIVVDDAVVVGENIHEMRERGYPPLEAAIRGIKGVMIPVTFSVLSNIIAFAPLLFVPGFSGKFFKVIPITVIAVFFMSLFESIFVLPAHLAHLKKTPETGYRAKLRRGQRRIAGLLDWQTENVFQPVLVKAVKHRYLSVACGIAILFMAVGFVGAGGIKFTFMPKIDTDLLTANASLTFGAPVQDTYAITKELSETAQEIIDENGGDDIKIGILTNVGQTTNNGQGPMRGGSSSGSHLGSVSVYLVSSENRDIDGSTFAQEWRKRTEALTGLETLSFQYSTGPAAGSALNIQLSHRDIITLEKAAAELAAELSSYSGVKDIDDGFEKGKPQYDFRIKPEAQALGLSAADLAGQLRGAFYGDRAFRQQRGREEIWVMVRLPEDERQDTWNVNNLMIRTPQGGEIPIADAATIQQGHAYTRIKRVDGRRVVNVTADVDVTQANENEILNDIVSSFLPKLIAKHQGLTYSFEGNRAEQQQSLDTLKVGFALAMLAIFTMLAIPFKSYTQPFLVMSAIPFGVVGAILGHVIMGYGLSIISMMGIVALSGVVVNDSLVLIHAVNAFRAEGANSFEAIVKASKRRFRPILLTSLTTFFGLAPMMLETSVQARFLIPMAISLGFGILFSTFVILLLVPAFYMILRDAEKAFETWKSWLSGEEKAPAVNEQPAT